MSNLFLTPYGLAARWCISQATLSQWRWNGKGPQFYKVGRNVRYKLHVVENFEEERKRNNTSEEHAVKELSLTHLLAKRKG